MGAAGDCFSASSASAFTAVISGAGVSVGVGEGSVVGGVPGRVTVADISYQFECRKVMRQRKYSFLI
jgi:hypothetical protein